MSFEGYHRVLCLNGHLHNWDVYSTEQCDFDEWLCPYCDCPAIWWETVDQTNDCGNPTELVVATPAVYCRCDTCSHKHISEPITFKIPDPVVTLEPRTRTSKKIGRNKKLGPAFDAAFREQFEAQKKKEEKCQE
jgi:hypothetical protein